MKKILLLFPIVLLWLSCQMFAENTPSSSGGGQSDPVSLVKGDALPEETRTVSDPVEIASDREDFVCYERRVRETRNLTEISNLGQNDDILYPGALIAGNGAASGSLTPALLPYGIERAPVTLSLGGITGVSTSVTIEDCTPTLSSTRSEINAKLTELVGSSAAARIEMSKEEVYSQEQFAMSVGVGATWPTGQSLDTAVDFSTTQEKSRIVIRFRQIYFSVDMDTPSSLNDLFVGGDADTIDTFIAEENPMYVSRVFYGRQVFFILESTCSSEELKVAVEGAMAAGPAGGAGPEVSASVALSHQQILENTTIKAVIYGGETDGAVESINGYDGLVSYLSESSNFDAATGSNALPLFYQMRFVEDNKIGAISSNADYTVKEYVRIRQRVKVEIDGYHCTGSNDGFANSTSEMMGEVRVRPMNSQDNAAADWVEMADFFSSPIAMNEGNYYPSSDNATITFTEVNATDSYVELYMRFVEDDASDDHLGTKTEKIYLSDGWNNTFEYFFENDGEGLRADITLTILP